MDTKTLEYLLVVAEERNISRAADRLYMLQSSLSRHIQRAETAIGAKLFYRERNELHLTDAGRIFMNNAQAILHIQQRTMEKLDEMRMDQKENIRIIIGPKEHTHFMRHALPQFYEKFPEVNVIATIGNPHVAREYLLNGIADIGMFATRENRLSNLEYSTIREDELMLALPVDSPAVGEIQSHGLDFAYMRDDPFVLNKDDNEYRQMEQEILRAGKFTPALVYEVTTLRAALHMVQRGIGNAFLSRRFVEMCGEDIQSFSLVPPHTFRLVAAYQKEKGASLPIMMLISIIKEAFATAQLPMEQSDGR